MKVKWKCLKCGEEFDIKPISHGGVYPTVFGVKLGKDEECNGEVIKIVLEDDCDLKK